MDVIFVVKGMPRYPTWDQKNGVEWPVKASSKSEAIRKVRAGLKNEMWWGSDAGRITYSARPIREDEYASDEELGRF